MDALRFRVAQRIYDGLIEQALRESVIEPRFEELPGETQEEYGRIADSVLVELRKDPWAVTQ